MHSALYEGWVRHRRFAPVANSFRYALYMMYLDLDELDEVFRKRLFWSARAFNLAWFRREDYLTASSRPGQPLSDAVRDLVQARTGSRPLGPIRLLTNLRHFGFGMNPVSFFYCFNHDGEALHSIVAEINNTPWNEQFAYVLPCAVENGRKGEGGNGGSSFAKIPHSPILPLPLSSLPLPLSSPTPKQAVHRFSLDKAFHISPFMDMAVRYDWRFTPPGERLAVHMINCKESGSFFDATMLLKRRAISTRSLASALLRHPFITMKICSAIYFHAAKLWIKGCPAFSHPT